MDLTERVLGAAIEVHKSLGPGFLESIYEAAFAVELSYLGIPFERQKVNRYSPQRPTCCKTSHGFHNSELRCY
jgi:GxxExxY protein